jgi:peptide/nickel transport system permease protein
VSAVGISAPSRRSHPIAALLVRRIALGVLTVLFVSLIVFAATQVLPGNAATAILGSHATPQAVRRLDQQLHLNGSLLTQYWTWISGLLSGDPGHTLSSGTGSFSSEQTVWGLVGPRLANSAALIAVSGLLSTILGFVLGAYAALRRGRWLDHVLSVSMLTVASLPEFVVAVALIIVFSTVVFQLLPAVSLIPPGSHAWNSPRVLVLPIATLVLVTVPYLFRMMRAAMIEALESEYVETARLKGVPPWQVALRHALPNALPPTIQVVGLNFLYLAGGIVVVEYVFNFPGIGQALVSAVNDRDVPVVQLIVVILASFYVLVNIITDLIALLATPRRRFPR